MKIWMKDFFSSTGHDFTVNKQVCYTCYWKLQDLKKKNKIFTEYSKFIKNRRSETSNYNFCFDEITNE